MTPDLALATDAVARLLEELGPGTCPDAVTAAVRQACDDLRGSPVGALPELVERLARVRLSPATADV
ncbi:three-helix bundle dimerization domain-containing protein [Pseudonocardia sp. HH130630-07]|uniref:three-helix bundle dimerization domain-containing protein n=1 Tax=Pseudonocardia sp. HH130630-07 TaxID=1690815 RepID=UPI000814E5C0|nr:hypothetical protein [Pseudonocardia sp. HH130630-07]ANY08521.1 hypothetical protein AFB00_22130 [Pseudonocardia sp. HH130630-07]